MPEPTDQPAKPLRTWRPMALWTAGILLILGLVWFWCGGMPSYPREKAQRVQCADHLRTLSFACTAYASDYDGRLPQDLTDLYRYICTRRNSLNFPYPTDVSTVSDVAKQFSCPCHPGNAERILRTGIVSKDDASYVYVVGIKDDDASDTVVLYDRLPHGDGKHVNVARLRQGVMWLTQEELESELKTYGSSVVAHPTVPSSDAPKKPEKGEEPPK